MWIPESLLFGIRYYVLIIVISQWAPWRLKPPASWLFAQLFDQVQIKENIKALRHWPLWGESTGDPHKRPATQKMFPFDDLIMSFAEVALPLLMRYSVAHCPTLAATWSLYTASKRMTSSIGSSWKTPAVNPCMTCGLGCTRMTVSCLPISLKIVMIPNMILSASFKKIPLKLSSTKMAVICPGVMV